MRKKEGLESELIESIATRIQDTPVIRSNGKKQSGHSYSN
jgi:hypothetical protein